MIFSTGRATADRTPRKPMLYASAYTMGSAPGIEWPMSCAYSRFIVFAMSGLLQFPSTDGSLLPLLPGIEDDMSAPMIIYSLEKLECVQDDLTDLSTTSRLWALQNCVRAHLQSLYDMCTFLSNWRSPVSDFWLSTAQILPWQLH